MPTFLHDALPMHTVPRIRTRILVGDESGAETTTIWEQWIEEGGHIPLHYHEVEEVLVILSGSLVVTLGETTEAVTGPATIVVPPRQLHGVEFSGEKPVHLLAFFPVKDPQIFDVEGGLRPLPWEDRDG
ncbi:MAG: cupin domain-containing protein [Pirellulaceae bacterium]|nr:cupin domain-containing protein [Pirellulaceae bacterium]